MHRTIFLFIVRILVTVGVVDTLYFLLIIFSLFNPLSNIYSDSLLFTIFWGTFTFLFLIQTTILLLIIIRWTTDEYYITEHQLFHYQGLSHIDEHIYELKYIKSVKIHQSFLGKIFNYGDIIVIMGAHGYSETLKLKEFTSPRKYERIFRSLIKE